MMKILHFSLKPPYPKNDGGCVAIAATLSLLHENKDIEYHHFTLYSEKHCFDPNNYPPSLRDHISGGKVNLQLNPFSAVKHLLLNQSYNVARFDDKAVRKQLRSLLENHSFEIVLMESIYLLPYLSLFRAFKLRVFVRTHNVEHHIWQSLANETKHFFKRKYLTLLAHQLRKFELRELAKVDGILAISEVDVHYFKDHFTTVPLLYFPVPVEVNTSTTIDYSNTDSYFLGAIDWQPNKLGLEWFLHKVIPEGLAKNTFYLAGKGVKPNQFQHPSVKVVGEVDNAEEFILAHGICIIPLFSGGGIKIKLLENMALGKPIVSTTEGVKGLALTNGKEVLIADTPIAFREAIERLQKDENLRKLLGENARNFILAQFNKQKITKQFIDFINKK